MKDIIGIGLVSTLLFPIVLVAILVMKGVLHFQVGMDPEVDQKVKQYVEPMTKEQAESDEKQMPSWEAAQKKAQEIQNKEEELKKEAERLQMVEQENKKMLETIDSSRAKFSKEYDDAEKEAAQKLASLAQIYGTMKPIEAAPILLNLSDAKCAQIIAKIPEPRQQAKLIAAMGALNQERAAEISRIIGYKKEAQTPKVGG